MLVRGGSSKLAAENDDASKARGIHESAMMYTNVEVVNQVHDVNQQGNIDKLWDKA